MREVGASQIAFSVRRKRKGNDKRANIRRRYSVPDALPIDIAASLQIIFHELFRHFARQCECAARTEEPGKMIHESRERRRGARESGYTRTTSRAEAKRK